jgi:hypothetical protein
MKPAVSFLNTFLINRFWLNYKYNIKRREQLYRYTKSQFSI